MNSFTLVGSDNPDNIVSGERGKRGYKVIGISCQSSVEPPVDSWLGSIKRVALGSHVLGY